MMHAVWIVLVAALVTMGLRFAPFLIFSEHVPGPVLYLGKVLPYAIMSMLVVYCLKNTDLLSGYHGAAEILGVLCVCFLHKWKHNTLLSIAGGTVCYMILVQFIFH